LPIRQAVGEKQAQYSRKFASIFGTRFLVVFWAQADAIVVIKTMADRLILIRRSVIIAAKPGFGASGWADVSQAVLVALNVPAREIAHNFQSLNFEGC
jgi:hypothetical protein